MGGVSGNARRRTPAHAAGFEVGDLLLAGTLIEKHPGDQARMTTAVTA